MIKKSCALLLTIAMLVAVAIPMAAFAVGEEMPIVSGIDTLSEKFSPFFAQSGYDVDVTSLTQEALMTLDRSGGIVYNAIDGETRSYNGVDYTYTGIADLTVDYDEAADITTYTAKLKKGVQYSDGVEMTVDDLIFTYYVYLDPSYTGSTQLASYNIIGVADYRTQTTADVYAKYADMGVALYGAGKDHVWSADDAWTEEQQAAFWQGVEDAWKVDVGKIVTTCLTKYSAYVEPYVGVTLDEALANDGLGVIAGMVLWGFGDFDAETGVFTAAVTGNVYDTTAGEYPLLDDYYNETVLAYEDDVVAYASVESPDETDVLGEAYNAFIAAFGPKDEAMSGGIPNISGIKKIDDYTVEVRTTGYEAPAVYSILGLEVAPMHYYGDAAMYDYENDMFGFPFGDLTMVQSKTTMPMGAGPYKFVKYENRVVYYEANDLYYKGAPLTKYFQFKETNSADVIPGITTATIDASELNGTKTNFESIMALNSNGEITGDVITTSKVDNRGYGYIGINAVNVSVGGEAGSEASKNLRKALATVFSIHRATAYDSYYGEAAAVIQYPISNTSWAAPQPTDPDFKVAFSVDVNGNDIYTADMTPDETYAAALEAAKGYLIAAGYTYDEATGMFTAAPEGAKLSYECIIPGDGLGDHPSFAVVTSAQAALATIGIELVINDPADSNVLWDTLDAGEGQLWCAAWQTTVDPDMYQIYHGSNALGMGGADSNRYMIMDDELDTLIVDARKSDDQAYRKALYKQALDIVVDWAVEIPAYQRQNCVVFSTERLDIDSITPAITTYWGWLQDIEVLKVK
ncbi:MAG: ABC transporter substrate-binding protein [Clostridiales bacterium]|nr:ABC transporter substrate-binding protein [Clostridiales bacterium]